MIYDVGEVADNVEHCLLSKIHIGYMWCVISEKQKTGSENWLMSGGKIVMFFLVPHDCIH